MGELNVSGETDSESGNSTDCFEDVVENSVLLKKRNFPKSTISNEPAKKKHRNDLYRPPTVEELNTLKETETLYNNNVFRLQIKELISEVNIKKKRQKTVAEWLKSFEKLLSTLPEYEFSLSSLKSIPKNKCPENKFKKRLAHYQNPFESDQDVVLKFMKPESYERFGLYELGALPGPCLAVHINLVMPKKCFLAKDFLNNRYFIKRYYYLLYIAEHIKASAISSKVNFNYHESNNLLPILAIKLNECDKVTIFIYASPAQGTFNYQRFLPGINNVKKDVFKVNVKEAVLKETPTILYNSSLAHDVTLLENNKYTKDLLSGHENILEGIKMLHVWMVQRELNIGFGALTESMIVYFIIYLFLKKKINKYMSSYQVIRNFWNFLLTVNLHETFCSLSDNTPTDTIDIYKKHFDIVCLDRTGCYNVTSFLTLELYRKIQLECNAALKYLDNNKADSFQQLFLHKHPFYLQYDLIIDLTKCKLIGKGADEDKCMYVGFTQYLLIKSIHKVLKRALNNRINNIVPHVLTEGDTIKQFLFGVNLNPDKAFSFLEMGPPLNDFQAASEFRKFWGHLSSDRRFKDGSVNAAVHFKANTIKSKRGIVKKIIDFALEEKLELKHYVLHYNEFEEVLVNKRKVPSYPNGTNEETVLKVLHACEELGKILRGLQMSLKITNMQGVSDVFSYTDVFPPIPSNCMVEEGITKVERNNLVFIDSSFESSPFYCKTINLVLYLEHSSKWPNDLEALRHLKTAFYMEIYKSLRNTHDIVSHATPDFIDVFYEGIVFRYRIYVPKEIGLLKRSALETGLTCFKDSAESAALETSLNLKPKVVSALKGVQSMYPSYGPGTCIVKRWLRSQLLDDHHFPDIAVDLINASLYLNNVTLQSCTPQISFLRCLKFFSDFDWELQTVLVDFNGDITSEEMSEIDGKLQESRAGYPALYIITAYDQGLSTFTRTAPKKEVLCRIRELARTSLDFIANMFTNPDATIPIKELFEPNLEGYHVLIHLQPQMNPRRYEDVAFDAVEDRIVIEKYKKSKTDKIPIVNFDPVHNYLQTLRRNYGKYALFFHNTYGGQIIGVLWHPTVFETNDFKVAKVNAGKLENGKIVFHMDAVIEDFYILGSGIVKSIENKQM